VEFNDDSVVLSEVKSVTTGYRSEIVSFTTEDGLTIAGKLFYLEHISATRPGIIFMHELGAFVNNWKGADVVINLVARGYVCLVIDFRGHGQSSPWDLPVDEGEVEEFINVLDQDLIAAMAFLKEYHTVDPNNLALVGGSLGGIMALAGNGFEEIKASVALSAPRLGVNSIFPDHQINAALFIAGELDINPVTGKNFADEAVIMHGQAAEPKKLIILDGRTDHGTELLSPSINQEIIDWIEANLTSFYKIG
jgi:alpha-beta hydrolase superfamily lysophospholipase